MAGKKLPDFRRAAAERLEAAETLFANEHYRDAVYLAGYVVECGLKGLLLQRTPEKKRRKVFETISRGVQGHNLDRMVERLRTIGCVMPPNINQCVDMVADWSPDWRYLVSGISAADAKRFLDSVRAIRAWIERSW